MPSVCPWVVLSTRGFRCAVFSVLPVPMACGMKRRDCLENLKRANTTNEIETLTLCTDYPYEHSQPAAQRASGSLWDTRTSFLGPGNPGGSSHETARATDKATAVSTPDAFFADPLWRYT